MIAAAGDKPTIVQKLPATSPRRDGPAMFLIRLPFSMAQKAIVPSSLAVARTFESSRQLMAVTAALWPSSA